MSGVTLSMVAHITPPELERDFDRVDLMSGYGNRFLFCWTQRTKDLPIEEPLTEDDWNQFVPPMVSALAFGHDQAPEDYDFTAAAWELWQEEVSAWKRDRLGSPMTKALKSRFRPQVRRLAVIYAVSDQKKVIDTPHLRAALAVWQYSVQTIEFCLAEQYDETRDLIGDQDAYRIFMLLKARGELSNEDIAKALGKHMTSDRRSKALEHLQRLGLVSSRTGDRGGRGRKPTLWSVK